MKTNYGFIGLGKMGGNLAIQAAEKGYAIVGYDKDPANHPMHENISVTDNISDFIKQLETPRKIFLYIPAGKPVDDVIELLSPLLGSCDIIVDGGNSYWGDSIRRSENLKEHDIYLVDCGTSGGVEGARNGACFMVGGDKVAVETVSGFLQALSVPGGFTHTGASGSGHFVKLVHNGIEFGMLQAIGEGMGLLKNYRDQLNISEILSTWNNGSVIRSWLIELMKRIYDQKKGFNVPSYIEDTGEVNWLITDAMHMEVAIPVIAQSVMQLIASRDTDNTWARSVAMMRNGFGGHPFGPDDYIKWERHNGKVGAYPPLPKSNDHEA